MPVTPLRPSDPASVGPHRLLARLGQGGMGTVYLGVAPDDRAVAVKVLRDGFPDPDARRRFRHELDALRRVRGPHLVEVLDADVEADTPYLVTRFVPGTRLDDLVHRRGPMPADELALLARGLADALATLHRAGVVHRDLTPGNVLVLDGQPHVIDLGLATAADVTAMTRSGLVIGTPGYLAPEQVTGSTVTAAVDVHAWGATVAFAGTGRPPFGTGRPEAVLYRIVHGEPDLEGLPESLAELVAAAMHPDPARRPDAAGLLSATGGPTTAEPVSVHLPRDVDVTTLMHTAVLGPDPTEVLPRPGTRAFDEPLRELATASTGPRAVLPAGAGAPPAWPSGSPHDERRDGGPYEDPSYDERPHDGGPYDEQPHDSGPYDDRPYDQRYGEPSGLAVDEHGGGPVGDGAPPYRHPARRLQVVATGAAAVGVLATATLVAPVVGAVTALVLLVLLAATGRASERLRGRRERRGQRRRDPLLAALSSPWHVLLALGDTLLSLPLLLLAAAVPAALVWLAAPTVDGLEPPELTAATAVVVGFLTGLSRRVHAPSRRLLRGALLGATPGTASATGVAVALAAVALVLLAMAEGAGAVWWPLQDTRLALL